jgi:hypothetical protein
VTLTIRCTVFGLLLTPLATAVGQGRQELDWAVLPLPPAMRSGAGIVRYTAAGGWHALRDATNALVCVTDEPDDMRISVACYPESLMPYVARQRALATKPRAVGDSLLAAEVRAGALPLRVGALSHNLEGEINPETGTPDEVWVWKELALPFADAEGTGLSTEDVGETPWLHHGGEYDAHVMIGWRKVPWSELVSSHP